jgi:vancomycin resistance protein YoaR
MPPLRRRPGRRLRHGGSYLQFGALSSLRQAYGFTRSNGKLHPIEQEPADRIRASLSARAPTTSARAQRRSPPAVRDRQLRVAVVLAGIVALALVVGFAFSGSAATIAAGTSIDGVNVGGRTPAAAQKLLEQKSAALAHVPVVFVAGDRQFTVRPDELDVVPEWSKAIASAAQEGNGMDVIRGFQRLLLRVDPTNIEPQISAYTAAVHYEIGRIAAAVDRPDRPARLVRHGLRVRVVPGRTGQVLDQAAAERIVVAELAKLSRGGPVTLPTRIQQPSVSTADLAAAQAAAQQALSAPVKLKVDRRTFVLTPRRLAPMLQLPATGGTSVVLGGQAADAYFAKLSRTVGRPARGARFAASGDQVSVIPQQPGIGLDVPRSAAAVLAAAESSTSRSARLTVTTVRTGRSTATAEAMGITGVVGSYETYFGGVPNRIHNVELVAHLIDGKLIAPGATFSFNDATGARTAAKGFLTAPVIINGELQTGLGGGVCQVSTTVFNAAYVAGLDITARTNHALYISHYPLGRDATVDYPDTDLKFVNDTPHWLLVRTFVTPSSLVVTLYGAPQHRRVVSNTAPLVQTAPIPVVRKLDRQLAPGGSFIETYGEAAYSTSVQRIVYAPDGKELSNETWYSNYRSSPEILMVGPKPAPPPKVKKPPATATTTTPAATTPTGSIGQRLLR